MESDSSSSLDLYVSTKAHFDKDAKETKVANQREFFRQGENGTLHWDISPFKEVELTSHDNEIQLNIRNWRGKCLSLRPSEVFTLLNKENEVKQLFSSLHFEVENTDHLDEFRDNMNVGMSKIFFRFVNKRTLSWDISADKKLQMSKRVCICIKDRLKSSMNFSVSELDTLFGKANEIKSLVLSLQFDCLDGQKNKQTKAVCKHVRSKCIQCNMTVNGQYKRRSLSL